ncbi:unnamed protein product [Effrenium voratum]|nr:unnamed protein product [Effrenium voratum]
MSKRRQWDPLPLARRFRRPRRMTSGCGLAPLLLAVGDYDDMKATDRQITDSTHAPMSRNSTEEGSTSTPAVRMDNTEDEYMSDVFEDASPRNRIPPWDTSRYEKLRVLRAASKHWSSQIEIHFDTLQHRCVAVKRFTGQWIKAQMNLQEALMLEREGRPGSASDASGVFQDYNTGELLLLCKEELQRCLFDVCADLGPVGAEREREALEILRSLLATAADLERLGVVHGRIRTENAWLQTRGEKREVLLSDFGSDDSGGEDEAFRAPELVENAERSHATDLFSCGVIGYALAMGRYPWFSSVPGKCKAFGFARAEGIQRFLADPRCGASKEGRMSAEYKEILSCLLDMDPSRRQQKSMSMTASLLEPRGSGIRSIRGHLKPERRRLRGPALLEARFRVSMFDS